MRNNVIDSRKLFNKPVKIPPSKVEYWYRHMEVLSSTLLRFNSIRDSWVNRWYLIRLVDKIKLDTEIQDL